MEQPKPQLSRKPRPADWIAAGAVVLVALALLLLPLLVRSEAVTVQVWQDGKLLYELPLDRDTTVTVGGDYENTIEIHGGAVFVSHATCPGGDCVRSGAIRNAGRSIVCLPNRLEIRIVGASAADAVIETEGVCRPQS